MSSSSHPKAIGWRLGTHCAHSARDLNEFGNRFSVEECGGVVSGPPAKDRDLTLAPTETRCRRDVAGQIGVKEVFRHTATGGGDMSSALVKAAMASSSRMSESLEWKQARQWLIGGGVIPPIHPATKPGADLVDFARCLRDGVYLCLALNRLKPNCVQYTARPYMQVGGRGTGGQSVGLDGQYGALGVLCCVCVCLCVCGVCVSERRRGGLASHTH